MLATPLTATAALHALEPSLSSGGAAAYLWAFGQGVLIDLTPCVYPLIPITVAVFGAKGVSRGRALFLATAYVMGMAALYTMLGMAVALSGAAFGAWLGNPWVVLPIAALLLALSASMFGAFDLQLPTSMQNRLGTVGGAGPVGAFLMGLVSGLISAPCTGPVLLSLLAYIAQASAQGHGVFYGGSLLFVYALGMGTLFFAVALGASLFRPGPWMEYIKSFFGIVLVVMALWFLRPIWPELAELALHPTWGLAIGVLIVLVGVAAGAIHLTFYGPASERIRKGIAVFIAVSGAQVALNNYLYVPPMAWHEVDSVETFGQAVAQAEADEKPILIDFGATWCAPCKEMEKDTFHDDAVEPVLATRFTLIKIDVSDPTNEQQNMHDALVGRSLPGVAVYGSDTPLSAHLDALRAGGPMPEPAALFKVIVHPEEFLDAIDPVR
jgi:thiol:disulfide interchange protein DsbD